MTLYQHNSGSRENLGVRTRFRFQRERHYSRTFSARDTSMKIAIVKIVTIEDAQLVGFGRKSQTQKQMIKFLS